MRATAEDRYAMVEAAVQENERFTTDRVEVDAGRPMHSVETVGILKARSPEDEWFFVTGADEVRTCSRGRSRIGCSRRS